MGGRSRQRYIDMPSSYVIGTRYLDMQLPYGDGPWGYPVNYTWSPPTGCPYQFWEWCMDETHPGPPFKTGGPLSLLKFSTNQHVPIGPVDIVSSAYRYTGSFYPNLDLTDYLGVTNVATNSALSAIAAGSWGDPTAYGATGWNKFRPTRSGADMGTFLGEIRDVPRMLRTTAKGFHQAWRSMGGARTHFGPKHVANHWLNTQFGWMPFLNDLRKFHKTTVNLEKRLNQLRKDNGQWVRRGGTVASSQECTVVVDSPTSVGLMPTLPTALYAGTPYGSKKATLTSSSRYWFEAAFRYWIPSLASNPWSPAAIACIYGLYPSPSLVWELTPWSWLVDWCSNAGDVIANMSSALFDNLTAKYAFIMGTTEATVDYVGTANLKAGPMKGEWRASLTRKSRVPASPFGFGLTGIDFSARQWSILGALGISRLKY